MRIAVVSPYGWTHPGGVTRHVEALTRELIAVGHDVRVLAPYDGDLDDYRRRVLSERGDGGKQSRASRGKPQRSGARKGGRSNGAGAKPLRQRVVRAEAEISRLTREIEKLDAALSEGDLFARDPVKATALAKARSETANALAKAEEDWLAAGAALEAATS